jgi:hypothetical protein
MSVLRLVRPSLYCKPSANILRLFPRATNQSFTFTTTPIGLGSKAQQESSTTTSDNTTQKSKTVFLHVGPSGDCWTGDSIFAAKHLQPDYVRSIPLTDNEMMMALLEDDDDDTTDMLLALLDENDDWAREIYDTKKFPSELLKRLKEEMETQEQR